MSGQTHQTPAPAVAPAASETRTTSAPASSNSQQAEAMQGGIELEAPSWWAEMLTTATPRITIETDPWTDAGAEAKYAQAVEDLTRSEPVDVSPEGSNTKTTVAMGEHGGSVTATTDDGDARSVTAASVSDDGTTRTTTTSSAEQTLDRDATAAAVKKRLDERAAALQQSADIANEQHASVQTALEALRAERTSRQASTDAPPRDLDAEEAALVKELESLEAHELQRTEAAAAVRAESAATTADNVDTQLGKVPELTSVDGVEGQGVEPTYSTDSGTSTTETHKSSGPGVTIKDGSVDIDTTIEDSSTVVVATTTDDVTTTETNARSETIDLAAGTIDNTRSSGTKVEQADGSSVEHTESNSSGVALDEGIKRTGSSSTSTTTTAADGSSVARTDEAQASGGLIVREDEVGVGGSGSVGASETTTDADGNVTGSQSATAQAQAEVTTKGANASGGVSSKGRSGTDDNHVQGSGGWKVFGGFTLDIDDNGNGTYSVVCTVTAGIQGNLGGGGKTTHEDTGASGGGALEVHGEASRGVTYRRVLTQDELDSYLTNADKLDSSQTTDSDKPEFITVANWYAGLDALGSGDLQAVTAGVGPDAAESLKPGESVQVVVTTKAGGSGQLDLGPVSGTAGHDVAFQRAITVAPITDAGGRRVDITVKVVDSSSTTGGVGIEPGAATGSIDVGSSSSDSQAVVFRLDPGANDYDADYSRILDADSLDELTSLAAALETKVQSRNLAESDSSSRGAGIGLGPVEGSVGVKNSESESVTIEGDQLQGQFSGSETAQGSLKVGGVEVVGSSNTSGVDARVDSDGNTTMRFDETQTDSGLGNGTGDMGVHDVLQSPKAMLTQMLATEWTVLSRFELSEAEVRHLYTRVDPHEKWGNAIGDMPPQIMVYPWEDLRDAIKSPQPDPEWVQVDPDVANDLARAKAMSHFMSEAGHYGRQAVLNLLRGSDTNSDIGLMTQWPPGLEDQKEPFYAVMSRRDGLADVMCDFIGQDDFGGAREYLDTLQTDTETVRTAIDTCTEFTESRSKGEMLDEMDKVLADVASERLSLSTVSGSSGPVTESDLLEAHIDPKLRTLESYKSEEAALIQEAHTWANSFWPDRSIDDIVSQAIRLTKQWRIVIFEVRELYEQHGISAGMRDISSKTSTTRSDMYEPNWDALIAVYREAYRGSIMAGHIETTVKGLDKLLDY